MYILTGVLILILGISIGQLIGQWSYKPIIKGYQSAIECYKGIIQDERRIRDEIIDEYNKTIDILKRHDELG